MAELETDVADKDKELKRKLQALDKGTGMAQSLHNELDKVKAKLSEAISEKDAATEAEEIQLRENEKLKVALEEAREKLEREKKRRKTVEIERTSDKDREAEVAALLAKIAQLESDKEAQRLKILKIEGERDELKSKIQKLEHAAEKNEVVRAPRRACRVSCGAVTLTSGLRRLQRSWPRTRRGWRQRTRSWRRRGPVWWRPRPQSRARRSACGRRRRRSSPR